LLGGLCRSAIERYDFFIYLAAPLVFPTTFLPAGTGATAAVLASGPRGGRFLQAARSCWRRAYTRGRDAKARR
jgi:hypothetical protein